MSIVSFALIGDPQFADSNIFPDRFCVESFDKHRALIGELNKRKLDFVVNLGDLGDGRSKDEIPRMLENCRKSVHPFVHVNGNHDLVLNTEEELKKLLGLDSLFYDFAYGKIRFIVLNGLDESRFAPEDSDRYRNYERYKKENPERKLREWDGMLSASSRKWLTEKLEKSVKNEEIVIILCHVPVWHGASPENAVMWDHRDILDILDRYPNVKAWFAGHYHKGGISPRKGVLHKTVKALCNVQVPTGCICRVFDDRIELEGIGEETNYTHYFELPALSVSGSAVPGAYVIANTGEIVRTDAEGKFFLKLESPGACCLKAVAEGYGDAFLPNLVPPCRDLVFRMKKDPSRHLVHGFTDGFATLKIMDGEKPVRCFDLNGTAFGELEKPWSWHEHSRNFWTRGEYAFTASSKDVKIEKEPYYPELRNRHWFKGDCHAHIVHGENFYRTGCAMFGYAARAEHYDWIFGSERHGNPGVIEDPFEIARRMSGKDFLYKLNSEFPKNHNGHVGNVGIEPVNCPIDQEILTNLELTEKYIWSCGGAAIPTHPLYEPDKTVTPEGKTRYWMTGKEIFLWLLCKPEMCSCVDFYYNDDTPGADEFYFRILNMGYRVGCAATSDAAFDVGRTPGSDRGATFVFMEELSEKDLVKGIREGRTMVSWNGGAVLYEIDGKYRIGDTLLPSDAEHSMRVDLYYRPGHTAVVRIFRNGKVFEEKRIAVPGSGKYSFEKRFTEKENAWYLVTVRDAADEKRIVSAASPVYFRNKDFKAPEIVPFPKPFPKELAEELRSLPQSVLTSEEFYGNLKKRLLELTSQDCIAKSHESSLLLAEPSSQRKS